MDSNAVARVAAVNVLAFRVAYGAALLVAPGKVAGDRWLGAGARQPAAGVGLRGVGGREVALHGLALIRMLRGEPVRPLLLASAAGDLVDVGATAAGPRGAAGREPGGDRRGGRRLGGAQRRDRARPRQVAAVIRGHP